MAEKTSQNSSGGPKKSSGSTTKPAAAAQKSAEKVDDCPRQSCRNCKRRIVINLVTHTLHAYETGKDGKEIERFTFKFVDGRNPHSNAPDFNDQSIKKLYTPTGNNFSVKYKKDKNYSSIKYKSPMPYAVFFTYTGEAIHQGNISKRSEHMAQKNPIKEYSSHGCIRITMHEAKELNCWAQLGDSVIVIGYEQNEEWEHSDSKKSEPKVSNKKTGHTVTPTRGKPYNVQSGDTIYDISKQSETTIEQIKKANPNIKNSIIKPGDIIYIPN